MTSPAFPDRVQFTSEWLQCNNHWMFALGREGADSGRLFYKSNTSISGVPGTWKLFGKTGRPVDAFKRDRNLPLVSLDMDNDVLLAIAEGGLVYRILDTFDTDPDTFFWRKSWGWPFDEGPQMRIKTGYTELCFSSSKEWSTMWTTDLDGNRHNRFIDHMYCLSSLNTLIHHNDPWTPGDWAYAFPSPEHGRLLPAKGTIPGLTSGINASGGVLGFIAPNGVWTIEYDFDIAGGNPLAQYVPEPLPSYEGIAPIVRFEKGARPVRLPSAPWRHHGALPGLCTAHIQVSPQWDQYGKVVPGSESRIIKILGLNAEIPGYWEKKLTDTDWHFIPMDSYSAEEIRQNLINDRQCEYGPELTSLWVSREKGGLHASLEGFGMHSNFFEPAHFILSPGRKTASADSISAELYTHIQMRTSRAKQMLARLRGRQDPQWLGAFIVIPEGNPPLAKELRRILHAKEGDRYAHLLVRAGKRKVELIKPLVFLNADIANALNRLLGKRIAVFTECAARK